MIVAGPKMPLAKEGHLLTRSDVLLAITEHIQINSQSMLNSLSGEPDDLERTRTDLAPGFARLVDQIHQFDINPRQIGEITTLAMESARTTPFIKRQIASIWLRELREFKESLTDR